MRPPRLPPDLQRGPALDQLLLGIGKERTIRQEFIGPGESLINFFHLHSLHTLSLTLDVKGLGGDR